MKSKTVTAKNASGHKLTTKQRKQIISEYKMGYRKLAAKFGVSITNVRLLIKRHLKKEL